MDAKTAILARARDAISRSQQGRPVRRMRQKSRQRQSAQLAWLDGCGSPKRPTTAVTDFVGVMSSDFDSVMPSLRCASSVASSTGCAESGMSP